MCSNMPLQFPHVTSLQIDTWANMAAPFPMNRVGNGLRVNMPPLPSWPASDTVWWQHAHTLYVIKLGNSMWVFMSLTRFGNGMWANMPRQPPIGLGFRKSIWANMSIHSSILQGSELVCGPTFPYTLPAKWPGSKYHVPKHACSLPCVQAQNWHVSKHAHTTSPFNNS